MFSYFPKLQKKDSLCNCWASGKFHKLRRTGQFFLGYFLVIIEYSRGRFSLTLEIDILVGAEQQHYRRQLFEEKFSMDYFISSNRFDRFSFGDHLNSNKHCCMFLQNIFSFAEFTVNASSSCNLCT